VVQVPNLPICLSAVVQVGNLHHKYSSFPGIARDINDSFASLFMKPGGLFFFLRLIQILSVRRRIAEMVAQVQSRVCVEGVGVSDPAVAQLLLSYRRDAWRCSI
jgi:hypothetical protein